MNYWYEDSTGYYQEDQRQLRSHCYPFRNIQNLTAFEVKVADHLCDIQWTNQNIEYNLQEYNRDLKGITIASLVLNAVTVFCIILYLLYSLVTYYRRRSKNQSVAL